MLQALTSKGWVNAEVRTGFGKGWPCIAQSVTGLYERWQQVGFAGYYRRVLGANVT